MSVKVVIAACFYYSGLVGLRRWWIQHLGPRLIILNYHTAAEGDLRKHLLYLRRHYRLLHLEEALEELYSPSVPSRQDRRTPLAITFDDGYYDNYTHCLALARELRIPLTIFLIPGYIETGDRFWWLEPDYLVTHASVSEVTIEGQTYQLTTSKERAALAKAIDSRIRFASSVAERETYLKEVRQLLAVPSAVTLEERGKLPVSWAEVEAFKKSEWISFGSHTMHHPLLAYLTDAGESDEEVRESRTVLAQRLQSAVRSFAYPVGKFGDIGEQGVRSVQRAGYAWAVTTINGVNTPERDPYLLHRFGVDVGEHWLVIAAKATGVWNFFTSLARMKFLQQLRTGYLRTVTDPTWYLTSFLGWL